MAYINQEMKQVIAANLKPVLAKYKVKATLSVQNNLKIKLTVKAGVLNIKNDFIDAEPIWVETTGIGLRCYESPRREPFFIDSCFHARFKGDTLDFLTAATKAMKSAGWYEECDLQTDYFNTAYYWDIELENYEYKGV